MFTTVTTVLKMAKVNEKVKINGKNINKENRSTQRTNIRC